MRIVNIPVLTVLLGAAVLSAQPAAEKFPPAESAVARQRASAAAMQESLARQRAALQKQVGETQSHGFFLLSPPPSMGATAPAPAPVAAASVAECEPLPPSEVDSLVEEAARHEDLDQALLRGVMAQESAFRPCAVSPKGAMGLMQLMPATATQFDVANPFDPASNLEAGAKFLKDLLVRYGGDLPRALGAYNAGPSRVDAAAGVPDIPETQDYVNRILSALPIMRK